MVAAWIKADTGVGPAIASGNQVNKGICADFPVAATNNKIVIMSNMESPTDMLAAAEKTALYSRLPNVSSIKNMAIRKPKSPIRYITKAFLAAEAYDEFLNQKPISKEEQCPTPAQPMNMTKEFEPNTRMVM